MSIQQKYQLLCNKPSDINEHLPTLKRYASQCNTVVELGARSCISTYAFLAAKPNYVVSYDIVRHNNISEVEKLSANENIKFNFIEADVLKIEVPVVDLLFIDTLHIYTQLKQELALHADKANKYIILHDTTTYAYIPEPIDWQPEAVMVNYINNDKGIWPAIQEFIAKNNWRIKERFNNNNGLTILEKTI